LFFRVAGRGALVVVEILGVLLLFEVILFCGIKRFVVGAAHQSGELAAALTAFVTFIVAFVIGVVPAILSTFSR
jgi:hypothetical protein